MKRQLSSLLVVFLATVFLFPVSAIATIHYSEIEIDGIVYGIFSDDETYNSEAVVVFHSFEHSIPYDGWNTDSILSIPSLLGGEYPVVAIMEGAFGGATDLKEVIIPASVKNIHAGAFGSSSIEKVYFDDNNWGMDIIPMTIDEGAFRNCKRLSTVTFTRPVESLGDNVFAGCSSLTDIEFYNNAEESLKTIGECAFACCTSLSGFDIPENVDSIGMGAFANCYSLRSAHIPKNVSEIGNYTFMDCHEMVDFSIGGDLTRIGKGAFACCRKINRVDIPSGVTSIGDYAFVACDELAQVTFPEGLTSIGEKAFTGCNQIETIVIPNSVTFIGELAFSGGDTHVIPTSPENYYGASSLGIGYMDHGWSNGGGLKKITIGSSIQELNRLTFAGNRPDTIICLAPVPPHYTPGNYDVFYYTSQGTYKESILCVPQVVVNAYSTAEGWELFENICGFEFFGNGDTNGDGVVSIGDVTALIDNLLDSSLNPINAINADVNGDGQVSIGDITALIDKLLGVN